MQISEIENQGLSRSYDITVSKTQVEEEVVKEIAKIQSTASLPGFRKGKAPIKIVRAKYEDQVMPDVVSKLVDKSFAQICKENNVRPATKPDVNFKDFDKGDDLGFTLSFQIFPDFGKIDFSAFTVDKYKVVMGEDDIEKVVEDLRKNMRDLESADDKHKIVEGDVAVIDFVGKIDGVEFDGGTGEGHELTIGSKQFIEGFEGQLIGHKKGDKVSVKVTFPENYHAADLKGKPAVFDVTIQDIKIPGELPEVNEEFFAKIGSGIKTYEDLKEKVKQYKDREFAGAAHSLSKKDLFDKLVDQLDNDVPEQLLKEELEEVKKMNPADDEEENIKIAKRRVLLSLYFIKLSDDEHIHVNQQEIRNAILDQARNFPGMEMQIVELYSKNQVFLDQIRNSVLEDKVVNHIMGKVKLNEIEISPKEFAEKI
ncbi:MAG: trigger factor [Alphaproteobacteria bacterium]|nr:trigger factor [Alphaproteobacteria bacterium]OJV12020.1 MAG: trigger factor [Alphaproteobacteria bacterium 33-17]